MNTSGKTTCRSLGGMWLTSESVGVSPEGDAWSMIMHDPRVFRVAVPSEATCHKTPQSLKGISCPDEHPRAKVKHSKPRIFLRD